MSNSLTSPVLFSFFGDPSIKRARLHLGFLLPVHCSPVESEKARVLRSSRWKLRLCEQGWMFPRVGLRKGGVFVRKERTGHLLAARANGGFGGGGGFGDSNTKRVLGNLALAIGLTYLTMTGKLGWLVDAIVSIWLFVVLLPIIGIGAFLFFAQRNMVQDSCPNCGNEIQILKSSLKDGAQLCPFCAQPFSVQNNKFVRESTRFSSNRSTFEQVFDGFSRNSEKEKVSSGTIVDIEAEVKDVD